MIYLLCRIDTDDRLLFTVPLVYFSDKEKADAACEYLYRAFTRWKTKLDGDFTKEDIDNANKRFASDIAMYDSTSPDPGYMDGYCVKAIQAGTVHTVNSGNTSK